MQRAVDATEGSVFAEDDGFAASDSETARPDAGRPAHGWSTGRGPEGGGEMPALSLSGDLRTMLLSDVLLWIATRHKTGTLHVRRGATRKRVVFQDGVLRSASSSDPRETLGQALVRDMLITEEQLSRTLLNQEKKGTLLGILLVSDGLLSADQLKRTLRSKAEQTVYDLFLWGEGGFYFQEGLMPRSVPMNLEMDTQAVVQEGKRRAKRWQRIRQRFPSSETTFKAGDGAQAPVEPVEREIFQLAAAGKTLAEIGLETRRSEFETAEHLFSLVELNMLSVERGLLPEADTTGAIGAIETLLARARTALAERQHDAAKEAFQDVLALDHQNRDAKRGLLEVSEGRQRQRATRRIPPAARPRLKVSPEQLAQHKLGPEERFLISRINGSWDVQSILKLCPLGEEEALAIFARLLDQKLIELEPA